MPDARFGQAEILDGKLRNAIVSLRELPRYLIEASKKEFQTNKTLSSKGGYAASTQKLKEKRAGIKAPIFAQKLPVRAFFKVLPIPIIEF
jgi:hypothetical protein